MDSYDVVVVRYGPSARPAHWRDVPAEYVEASPPLRNLALPLATTWVRAFNQAELARPYGVWALLRPQAKSQKPGFLEKPGF